MRRAEVQNRIDMLDNYDRNGELTDEERANLWMMKKLFQLTKDEKEEEEPVVRFYDIEPVPVEPIDIRPDGINWVVGNPFRPGVGLVANPVPVPDVQPMPIWLNEDIIRFVDRWDPEDDITRWGVGEIGVANQVYMDYLNEHGIRDSYEIRASYPFNNRVYHQVERVA